MLLGLHIQHFLYKNKQQHVDLSATAFEVVGFDLGQCQEIESFVVWLE